MLRLFKKSLSYFFDMGLHLGYNWIVLFYSVLWRNPMCDLTLSVLLPIDTH